MQVFSDYYQDISPSIAPTFEKYFQPDPIIKPEHIQDTIPYISQLAVDYDMEEMSKMYIASMSNVSRVEVALTSEQVKSIAILARRESSLKISTMDALAAYFVTVINRISSACVDQLIHVIEVRATLSWTDEYQ